MTRPPVKLALTMGVLALLLALIGALRDADRSGEVLEDSSTQLASTDTIPVPFGPEPASNPAQPVTDSVALGEVGRPPDSTVAMIEPSEAEAGAAYSIIFVPYGKGPSTGDSNEGLIINISESTPADGVKRPFDFATRNALVDASRVPASEAVTQGGTYEGTLVLIEDGGLLVPQLTSVSTWEKQ